METLESISDQVTKTKRHLGDMMDDLIKTQKKLDDLMEVCKMYQSRFDRLEGELEALRQAQNGSRAESTVSSGASPTYRGNSAIVFSQDDRRKGKEEALVRAMRKASFPEVPNPSRPVSPPLHDAMATSAPSNPASYARSSISASPRPSPAPSREASTPPSSAMSGEILARLEEIKREYNGLETISEPMRQQHARNAFIQKHGVVGLICTNSQARMGNPSLKPEFGEVGSPQKGDLWAVQLDKSPLWAVMPRQNLNYESQRNHSGGLGEIFDSNFEGGTYSRISLAEPAIFQRGNGGWDDKKKGRIVLSR